MATPSPSRPGSRCSTTAPCRTATTTCGPPRGCRSCASAPPCTTPSGPASPSPVTVGQSPCRRSSPRSPTTWCGSRPTPRVAACSRTSVCPAAPSPWRERTHEYPTELLASPAALLRLTLPRGPQVILTSSIGLLTDIDNPELSDFGHDPGWVIALKAVL